MIKMENNPTTNEIEEITLPKEIKVEEKNENDTQINNKNPNKELNGKFLFKIKYFNFMRFIDN